MKNFGVDLFILVWVGFAGSVRCESPAFVNVGAVFTYDSVIGRSAKTAMEAAVSDINADPTILNGTKLNLITENAYCNVFLGSIGAFQVLEKEVVAIVGPQASSIAHMISQIANGLQVPLVSYAATDPTLSALQYPYFIRTTPSDSYQMAAMADLIDFYGWKQVITIFEDNSYGRNGISALDNELEKKVARVSHKLPMHSKFSLGEITDLLNNSKLLGPRVYVVHLSPDPRLRIFKIAEKLQMMTNNYAWLATDWLLTTLDSLPPADLSSLELVQGVVGFRQHFPESNQKTVLLSRLSKQEGSGSSTHNAYALYAYDTIWLVAQSIDKFLKTDGNLTFSLTNKLHNVNASRIHLGDLKLFNGGDLLLSILLESNFTGLTGQVQFSSDRNIVGGSYDVINIDRGTTRNVGFWSNITGFTVLPPEALNQKQISYSRIDQKLDNVTWPGGRTERPRGWVIADNAKPLKIGVPNRASFVEFVTELNNSHTIQGYCIDVFIEARKLVPYHVPYIFVPFGDGHANPSYSQLVKNVADNVFDAAVGDIAIVTNRTKIVDFSQPFIATGLVIVAPIQNSKSSAWVFLKPFTVEMWCVTAASFLMVGMVIWVLEHRVNKDFRGPPKRQITTVLLFSFSTLFKTNQEVMVSPLARMVMVVWLFLLMVITSSYTASLTSILTVQQLASPITGIDSLVSSNWPIGYQVGSFAYNYLTESLFIHGSRLVSLGSPEEYEKALRLGPKHGGVAAIIDELPYVELFLSKTTEFGIVGQTFTKSGWGFAFQRDSPLAIDISTAILKLSENGDLQKIREKWFCQTGCPGERTENSSPNQLPLMSFWGLYFLCGVLCFSAFLLYLLRMVRQFIRYNRNHINPSSHSSSASLTARWSRLIRRFVEFFDEKEEAIKKIFRQHDTPPVPAI